MSKWQERKIGSLCTLINGRAFKPTDWDSEGLPIVRIQNLNDETKPFNYFNGSVEEKYYIDNGELLFSWSGTPGTSFGAFFWNRGKAILNQHIFRVIHRPELIDPNYFRYALNFKIQQIIDQAHGGVGLKHITKGKFEATKVPLPPLDEQRRIAAILDQADALRRKRQQALAKLDQLVQSVFLDMFGDPVTNPKGWEIKTINELKSQKPYSLVGGPFGSNLISADYVDSGVPVIRGTNMSSGIIKNIDGNFVFVSKQKAEELYKNKAYPGDIIFTQRGTLGQVAWISPSCKIPEFIISQSQMKLTCDQNQVLPQYLYHLFKIPSIELLLNKKN